MGGCRSRRPGAQWFEYDSEDHYPCFEAVDEQLDVIERFLTGELHHAPADRILATVVFTDIYAAALA